VHRITSDSRGHNTEPIACVDSIRTASRSTQIEERHKSVPCSMGITRIDASGSLVTGDSGSSSLCSSGRTFDVFGFNLDWKSLLIVMVLVAVMLGPSGCECTVGHFLCHENIPRFAASLFLINMLCMISRFVLVYSGGLLFRLGCIHRVHAVHR
jgi:hypothetical protein